MKVLFFAPHSAIWVHAFPEALVAEALEQYGDEVVYIACSGLLKSHCISMSAYGVPYGASLETKERICRLCRGNKDLLRKRFGFRGRDLSELVTDADRDHARALASALRPETCTELVVDGVEVGRLALYELMLQAKKSDLRFFPQEWERYRSSVVNCLMVLRISQRLFDEFRPDRVVVYNSLYSVNRIVCRLAEERGIPDYFLHAGPNLFRRLQRLILARGHNFLWYRHLRERWLDLRDRPCPAGAMRSATLHFLSLARATSVYAYSSAPRPGSDVRRTLGIEPRTKVVSATLSSQDEFLCGQLVGAIPAGGRYVFATQLEWVRALLAYFERRPDLTLVIRVHPREFPNKREGVLSEHAGKLKDLLGRLPANVRVNWPTDGISLYDLANVTDVFLNGWSTAGKEMAWLGLPVVLYSPDLTDYPADLNYVALTEPEYYQTIDRALTDGWDPERIRRTYRWCAIEYDRSLLDISESYSRREGRSLLARGMSLLVRAVAPYRIQRSDCRHRAPRLSCADKIHRVLRDALPSPLDLDPGSEGLTREEETELLKAEVRTLLEGLYGRARRHPEGSLAAKLSEFSSG